MTHRLCDTHCVCIIYSESSVDGIKHTDKYKTVVHTICCTILPLRLTISPCETLIIGCTVMFEIVLVCHNSKYMDCDTSVGIVTGYGLDGCGLIAGRGKRFSSAPQHPDRLWGPPSLLSNWVQGAFPRGWSSWGVKLTIHLHLVLRSRMAQLYLHSPIHLYGVMLN
jgi:hypothetical protein